MNISFFRNALGDGKRAIILKNNWTKVGFFYILPWANNAIQLGEKSFYRLYICM